MTDRETDAASPIADVSLFKILLREIASPHQRLRRMTQLQLQRLNRQDLVVAAAPRDRAIGRRTPFLQPRSAG